MSMLSQGIRNVSVMSGSVNAIMSTTAEWFYIRDRGKGFRQCFHQFPYYR
jgi:hypothetical protein